jgi:hypothetical protein
MHGELGGQHLDPQQLCGGVLANARRGKASVEAVARTRKQARSGTVDGVAPKLATIKAGGGAEDRASVARLMWPVNGVPNDPIVGSGRKSGYKIQHHAHGGGSTAHIIGRWGGKGTAASMNISPNKHDVGAAPTLAATEAERIETHKVWHVPNLVAGFVDRLEQAAATSGGDGGGSLETQNFMTDETERTHTINGELKQMTPGAWSSR